MEKEAKLKKIKVVSYVFLVFVFIVGVFFYSQIDNESSSAEIAKVFTEKGNYTQAEELKIEIVNDESETICFSPCPYAIQVKKQGWEVYNHFQCQGGGIIETCVSPGELKAFAISLNGMFLEPAIHRLAIPVCLGCAIGEQFRVDKIIYSNEFEIK